MPVLGLALAILIGVSLGFFGGGGSILTVPLLVYVFGLDPKVAIASSLLIVGTASLFAAFQHWRAGNLRPVEGAAFGLAGMVGAYLGGRAGAYVDGGILLLLFASMMAITSVGMWRGRRQVQPQSGPPAYRRLMLQGLAVGSFTGLVGAGGGFLIVPALALWARLPMPAAVGTSLFVIVLNCAAGFAGYAAHVDIDARLVGAVAATAVAGSFLGARLAHVVSPASLRRAFALFVGVMALAILGREGPLVARTLVSALPHTGPQLVFALFMLAVGLLAGRASTGSLTPSYPEGRFHEGDGI